MIDFAGELNAAQLAAVTTIEGPVLVIAGAGSGKTRTIVYRLANLVQSGVPPSQILLLTFTRKAAREMQERAARLIESGGSSGYVSGHGAIAAVQGGTFHAFAYSVLRVFRPVDYVHDATVMDAADMTAALQHCKSQLGLGGKGDTAFPKIQTILSYISKSRNCEQDLTSLLTREAPHLLPHAPAMQSMANAYLVFKRDKALLDYDDLLFELEKLLRVRGEALAWCWRKYRYIMVDEYQDTNRVQARIAALLAGVDRGALGGVEEEGDTGRGAGNILAVGDDAQSIYAFRGADVRNILAFPEVFAGTEMISLEENYRSTQPILDLTNAILADAREGYTKHLFTRLEGGKLPEVIRPLSDLSQAALVAAKVVELLRSYPPHEIAVLFRAGYQSYHLEVQLTKLGVRFSKHGGIRYTEAAHVKDAVSFARLVCNPLDFTAFQRMASLTRGIGAKTCLKLYEALRTSDSQHLVKAMCKYPAFGADVTFLEGLRLRALSPADLFSEIISHYSPRMEEMYPDDYPKRLQGLEQLAQIAASYTELDLFIADLSLDDPLEEDELREHVTLSTIHSAKGLEWSAVLIIDLVEERFPSRHALIRDEDMEEERRLMYVAATRAREYLGLFVPATLYSRGTGSTIPAVPSPFVRCIPHPLYDEWQEGFTGLLSQRRTSFSAKVEERMCPQRERVVDGNDVFARDMDVHAGTEASLRPRNKHVDSPHLQEPAPVFSPLEPGKSGYCHHKIFGRGKVVQHLPPDKYRVNFPGMGLKVIMAAFLRMEE